jgi:hypothetical protein
VTVRYRCNHTVEAMRWIDTDLNRELIADWFDKYDCMFETRGLVVCLPEGGEVREGDWILHSDDEFITMDDECFSDSYTLADFP